MLLITATGLLNSAILSMSHEHAGIFGCQFWYGSLGYAIFAPVSVFLLEEFVDPMDIGIPW